MPVLSLTSDFLAKFSLILLNSHGTLTRVIVDLTLSISVFSFFPVALFALCTLEASTEKRKKSFIFFFQLRFFFVWSIEVLWSHALAETNHQL